MAGGGSHAVGDRVELRGVALVVVEAFPVYRTRGGGWTQLVYARAEAATSKDVRMVALEASPDGVRAIEGRIRALRAGP